MADWPRRRWVLYVDDYAPRHAEAWPGLANKMPLALLPARASIEKVEAALSALFQALVLDKNDFDVKFALGSKNPYPQIEWNPVHRHCEMAAGGMPSLAATTSNVWVRDGELRWEPLYWPPGMDAAYFEARHREIRGD